MSTDSIAEYIARVVAAAPPLNAEQRDAISFAFSKIRPPRIPDSDHGTIRGYKILGCRCDKCRAANAYVMAAYRAGNAERFREYGRTSYQERRKRAGKRPPLGKLDSENADDPRHGTRTGYTYGCRCARCTAANSRYAAERARVRAAK